MSFATDMAGLTDDLLAHGYAVAGTYRRKELSAAVTAVLGDKLLSVADASGQVRTVRTDLDLIIKRSDLSLGGNLVEPAAGDVWEADVDGDGTVEKYEVRPVFSEEPFRVIHAGSAFRVHAKYVGPA